MNTNIDELEPTFLSDEPSATLLINLLSAINELFQVDEQLRFVDRPQLFTLDNWRQSSIEEFDFIGSRTELHLGMRILAKAGYIEVLMITRGSDRFMLRLRADAILGIIKEIK